MSTIIILQMNYIELYCIELCTYPYISVSSTVGHPAQGSGFCSEERLCFGWTDLLDTGPLH